MCYLRGWSQTPAASTRDARLLTLLMREEVLAPSKAVLRHKDADASMVRAAVAVPVCRAAVGTEHGLTPEAACALCALCGCTAGCVAGQPEPHGFGELQGPLLRLHAPCRGEAQWLGAFHAWQRCVAFAHCW